MVAKGYCYFHRGYLGYGRLEFNCNKSLGFCAYQDFTVVTRDENCLVEQTDLVYDPQTLLEYRNAVFTLYHTESSSAKESEKGSRPEDDLHPCTVSQMIKLIPRGSVRIPKPEFQPRNIQSKFKYLNKEYTRTHKIYRQTKWCRIHDCWDFCCSDRGFKGWLEKFSSIYSYSQGISYFTRSLHRHYYDKHDTHNFNQNIKHKPAKAQFNKFKHCLICNFAWHSKAKRTECTICKQIGIYPKIYPIICPGTSGENDTNQDSKPLNPDEAHNRTKIYKDINHKIDDDPAKPPSRGNLGLLHPFPKTVVTNGDRDNPNPICMHFIPIIAHTRTQNAKILRFSKFSLKRRRNRAEFREQKTILKNANFKITWGKGTGLLGRGSLIKPHANLQEVEHCCHKKRSPIHKATKTQMNQLRQILKQEANPNKTLNQENQHPKDYNADPSYKQNNIYTIKNGYLNKIKIATLNVRGFKEVEKQEQVMHWMEQNRIDILALQETYVNTNSKMKRGKYTYFFSTNISDKQRIEATQQKTKGKGKGKQKLGNQIDQERHGVAFIVKNSLLPIIKDINQIDGRIITLLIQDHASKLLICNNYVPHSGYELEVKTKHYENLQSAISKQNSHTKICILGDFNTRLQYQRQYEEHIIGKHIYRTNNVSENCKRGTMENRELFIQFCEENNLVAANTLYSKSQDELYTYISPEGEKAQIDFILYNKKWCNSIKNAGVDVKAGIYSDHRPIVATLHTKLAKPFKPEIKNRYQTPNEEQKRAFNSEIHCLGHNHWQDHKTVIESLKTAAEKHFQKVNPLIKKSYISEQTWTLIQERQEIMKLKNMET